MNRILSLVRNSESSVEVRAVIKIVLAVLRSFLFFGFVLFLDRVTDQTVNAATDKEDG